MTEPEPGLLLLLVSQVHFDNKVQSNLDVNMKVIVALLSPTRRRYYYYDLNRA